MSAKILIVTISALLSLGIVGAAKTAHAQIYGDYYACSNYPYHGYDPCASYYDYNYYPYWGGLFSRSTSISAAGISVITGILTVSTAGILIGARTDSLRLPMDDSAADFAEGLSAVEEYVPEVAMPVGGNGAIPQARG